MGRSELFVDVPATEGRVLTVHLTRPSLRFLIARRVDLAMVLNGLSSRTLE